ncbi:MAG: DUF1501 domain-containing protein [Bacteroidetes bacterium]|nr:DUF1501 domain-containing protein [Bacteroidota bacterium]
MKRRDFLKATPALSLPVLINGFPLKTMAENPLLHLLGLQSLKNGRVLVLVQLNGGNDGLNTVLNLDRYAALTLSRSNILIPQSKVLSLNGSTTAGLNPAMTEMQTMFNSGLMNIVQAVSYPTPSFSHFRATDIWLTAAASNQYLNTGWLGRTMDQQFPGYPDGYPTADMPDPLAVQISSQASMMTQSSMTNTAFTVTNPNSFYNLVNGTTDPTPDTPYGHELDFLRLIRQQTNAYGNVIKTAYGKAATLATYPTSNSLADQLKIVARLIKGGLKTPIYIVNHPNSFDTHSNQVNTSDTTTGTHANLLSILSKAISAFQQDITLMGVQDRVTGMTFTEFGRRPKSNASVGTDHDTAIPMFFFGTKLNPAVTGASPVLGATQAAADNPGVNDHIQMQFDFRSVYYTVLKDWFQLTDTDLAAVLFTAYPTLPIFNQLALPTKLLSFNGSWPSKPSLQWVADNDTSIVRYEVERSATGSDFQKIGSVTARQLTGQQAYSFPDSDAPASVYYYRLKMVDIPGTYQYSSVIMLRRNQQPQAIRIKVSPNPVSQWFTLNFDTKVSGPVTVRMNDIYGREVWKEQAQANDAYSLPFSLRGKTFAKGVYVIQVQAGGEEGTVKVLVEP